MADHKVDHWILISSVFSLWVAPKHVEDVTPVVVTRRDLTIAVICGFSSGPSESLGLIAFREFHESEVRVRVPTASVEQHPGTAKTVFKPVLEMEFLVSPAHPVDENPLVDSIGAGGEDLKCCCFLHSTSCQFVETILASCIHWLTSY